MREQERAIMSGNLNRRSFMKKIVTASAVGTFGLHFEQKDLFAKTTEEPDEEVSEGSIKGLPIKPTLQPLVRVLDLNIGQSQVVELHNGSKATVKLVDLEEIRDRVRSAMRIARVKVEINGKSIILNSGNYHLPVVVAGVQIDCTVIKGYYQNTNADRWGLVEDARLRL